MTMGQEPAFPPHPGAAAGAPGSAWASPSINQGGL